MDYKQAASMTRLFRATAGQVDRMATNGPLQDYGRWKSKPRIGRGG